MGRVVDWLRQRAAPHAGAPCHDASASQNDRRNGKRSSSSLAVVALAVSLGACVDVRQGGDASEIENATGLYAMNARLPATTTTKTALVNFDVSAFPYSGVIPEKDKPFLDVITGGRRGHTSPSGNIVWEDQAYHDRRVLLSIPAGFDPGRPALIVVFFHGRNTLLERDVVERQRVPLQLAESGLNAVLVAPQLASDAPDSSAGRFWEPNVFARFIDEAASHLASLYGHESAREIFRAAPVVIMAYSGGYLPAAFSLAYWGESRRLRGVILLDAAYGELDKFTDWIVGRRDAFFFSAYSKSSADENDSLQQMLAQRGIPFATSIGGSLAGVTFQAAPGGIEHNDFLIQAWVSDPVRAVLSRIGGFSRTATTAKRKKT
jgi:hypothetical protein